MILLLPALASFWLTWDDPSNPPANVAGYNVYRVEFTGTGEMIRHRVNAELIPWQEDTENTPRFRIEGAISGEQYRGTAVGKPELFPADQLESEISDDYYTVPFPPAAVPGLTARLADPDPDPSPAQP